MYTGQPCFNIDNNKTAECEVEETPKDDPSYLNEHNHSCSDVIVAQSLTDVETYLHARTQCITLSKEIINDIYNLDNLQTWTFSDTVWYIWL
jgi:hypothetical protein